MPKFGLEEHNSFVRVATHGGAVMMVEAVHPNPAINRYDLRAINGSRYSNIGEYELTLATEEEVRAALNSRP